MSSPIAVVTAALAQRVRWMRVFFFVYRGDSCYESFGV
jgi:hypothetical protein